MLNTLAVAPSSTSTSVVTIQLRFTQEDEVRQKVLEATEALRADPTAIVHLFPDIYAPGTEWDKLVMDVRKLLDQAEQPTKQLILKKVQPQQGQFYLAITRLIL